MKPFVRRICRVFLITGITGLLTLIGGAPTLLGHPQTANADSSCPFGYHPGQTNYQSQHSCLPNAGFYCPQQGQVWRTETSDCEWPSPYMCNPRLTKQNPDNYDQCLPMGQLCGTNGTPTTFPPDPSCIPPQPIPMPFSYQGTIATFPDVDD